MTDNTIAPPDQAAANQQPRHPLQSLVVDDDAEDWGTLMMGIEAAKEMPHVRKELEEILEPEVLRAADECSSYEDFKQRLTRYQAEGLPKQK